MKRNLLAVSVAAALGVVAGAASAATTVSATGIGHTNIIPYFSVQGGNATLLSITNTDQIVGKAVKVRFRGAEWSDDIFDFQVFLSPGDVFTGAVTNNNGTAAFATADGSCTLPASVNQDFVPIRLQNATSGTLEGYIEIITMADIDPAGTVAPVGAVGAGYNLFTATKHVGGVAPCKSAATPNAAAAVSSLVENSYNAAAVGTTADWMVAPGAAVGSEANALTSYATIINVNSSKAFSNVGTAINFSAPKLAYFRQANDVLAAAANLTNDQIFFPKSAVGAGTPWGGAGVTMYQFDMPDLSTPLDVPATAVDQRNALTTVLQKTAVVSEYSTLSSINGATDIVLSQPTRRYYYKYDQLAGTATTFDATIGGTKFLINGDPGTVYASLTGSTNRINLANLAGGTGAAVFYDREEQKASSNIVISPTPPGGSLSLKGEVSVVGINISGTSTGALGGVLTMNGINATGAGGATYQEGWAMISTMSTGATGGKLPIIGFSAQNAFNAGVGAAGTNYGTTLPLRYLP